MAASNSRLSAARRRSEIEAAATTLLARKGVGATTMADIATAAGVTKPIIYRHFDSKQELCVALLERYRDELVAVPLAEFRPGADEESREQIERMLDAWLGWIEAHPDAAQLLFTPIPGESEEALVQRELFARQRGTQAAVVREFAPGLDDREAEPLGEAIRAALGGVALWWLERPDVPREVPAQALVRMVEGTIASLRGAVDDKDFDEVSERREEHLR
jgi:AcrR family transcriptional regulator